MFPIRDHNPSQRTPFVTYALLVANIGIYALTALDPQLFAALALYPRMLTEGWGTSGLLTHMFAHAGLLHLGGNMLFLWVFGNNIEDQLGHFTFLLFYLACGLCAAAAHIMSGPASIVPMVGASGAIAGVMGGYLLMFPRARIDVIALVGPLIRRFTVPAWVVLAAWAGLQLVMGAVMQGDSGVAYWAHIGGFLAGMVLIVPVFMRRGGTGFWARNQGRPPHPAGTRPGGPSVPIVTRKPRDPSSRLR